MLAYCTSSYSYSSFLNSHSQQFGLICLSILFITISFIWNPSVAHAMPAAAIETSQRIGAATQAEVTRDEVNLVARDLWCPLCSGVRLDVCELKACEQMREEIALQLADGASDEEITDYFLAQYGPQILGQPPRSGFNWLAWIVPFAALLGGGMYLLVSRRRASNTITAAADSSATYAIGDAVDHQSAPLGSDQDEPASNQSKYEQRLDKELESYD